jgi:hypothetical protein
MLAAISGRWSVDRRLVTSNADNSIARSTLIPTFCILLVGGILATGTVPSECLLVSCEFFGVGDTGRWPDVIETAANHQVATFAILKSRPQPDVGARASDADFASAVAA